MDIGNGDKLKHFKHNDYRSRAKKIQKELFVTVLQAFFSFRFLLPEVKTLRETSYQHW